MKCLKSTKTRNIIRIDDKQAHSMVGREWQYVSKEQWKSTTRVSAPIVEAVKEELTVSEKQLKRKKK
jgi:hypothetical protein